MEENNTVQSYHEGSCVYRGDGSLGYILHPEGVVRATGQGLSHEYFLKDHLGSTRVVFGSNGAVLQATDYYAFGLEHTPKAKENENRYLYNGKELQDETFAGGVRLGWYDYGWRFYDATIARWHVIDPMIENNHHNYTPYAYVYNNPLILIDKFGLDSIYVLDQANRPTDNGTAGNTYTADIYVVQNGQINGPYSGSSYPNSVSNTDNITTANTINEGEHSYNNQNGHTPASTGVTEKGLNIDDDNNANTRTTSGTDPNGNTVTMTNVNVHEGESDNGNYNSRGSQGCVTVAPNDADNFFNNFNWNGTNGFTGNSTGTIFIQRGNSADGTRSVLQGQQDWQQNPMPRINPISVTQVKVK